MELHQIFNTILLTLSLATIMLTMVSFALYKLRQMPALQNRDATKIKMQGVFFKRYAPHGTVPVASPAKGAVKLEQPLAFVARNVGVFFSLMLVVVFGSLTLEGYLRATRFEKTRVEGALSFKKLYEQGLMRSYDYAFGDSSKVADETILPAQRTASAVLAGRLKNRKFFVLDSEESKKYNAPIHDPAVKAWVEFLEKSGLAVERVGSLGTLTSGQTVILPQLKAMSAQQREAIEAGMQNGAGFVASGPIALQDGGGVETKEDWAGKVFNVRLVRNAEPSDFFPTVLSAESPALWDVPPGLLVPWFPSDNSYQAVSQGGASSAFEASFRGEPRGPELYVRVQFQTQGPGRNAWLALDPPGESNARKLTPAERFNAEYALLSTLAWAAQLPQARVSTWRGGHRSAIAPMLDADDSFENAEPLMGVLKAGNIPATVFMTPKSFGKAQDWWDQYSDSFELAEHWDAGPWSPALPAERQFEQIQSARLDLEASVRRRVGGYQPPSERYDESTIQAVLQNHQDYFVGDSRFLRFAPIWIAGGKLLFVPRAAPDDIAIEKRRDLVDPLQVSTLLLRQQEWVTRLGGVLVLGIHTSVVGQPVYRESFGRAIVKALEETEGNDPWKTTLGGVVKWWKERSQVSVEFSPAGNGSDLCVVAVKNSGSLPVEEFNVTVDPGRPLQSETRLPATATNSTLLIKIDRLNAGEVQTHSVPCGS